VSDFRKIAGFACRDSRFLAERLGFGKYKLSRVASAESDFPLKTFLELFI
jgi:hypothetical protein